MLDEIRVPDGGTVVIGTTGTDVAGGRDVVGGEAVVGGRDVAGDAGDGAMPVDPCADFVLTEPLGADVEDPVAPAIDGAAPPRDVTV
jgi:hypothetical protein